MARTPSLDPKLKQLSDGGYAVWVGGIRHRLGSDLAVAEQRRRRLVADWLASRAAGLAAPPGAPVSNGAGRESLTVAEACALYLRHQIAEVGASQYSRCRDAVRLLCDFCGAEPVQALDRRMLRSFREHLVRLPSRRGGSALLSRLIEVLSRGPMPAGQLDTLLAGDGHDRTAVSRARHRLGCQARRVGRRWLVSLPDDFTPPPAKPLSRRYVNHLVGVIKACWFWLESEDRLPAGAGQALRAVRALRRGKGGRETPPVLSVPAEVVELTLPRLRADLAAMVRLQLLAGMRPGEVCLLRPCDLSRDPETKLLVPVGEDRVLRIGAVRTGEQLVWLYVPCSHKTAWKGRPRVVPLGPRAQEILAPLLSGLAPTDHVFSPRRSLDALRAARGQRGRYGRTPAPRWTTASYAQAIETAAKKAGVPHWTPNQLRHTRATEVSEEYDLDTAAALLGHARPDTTLVYAELAIRKAARAAAGSG